ncbi:hypothetical protein AC1031_016696 [Aphanomyces cochlioides]|nr:hypothetical protein AC1031_016696 [Aphanomyces cochlioides]
MHLYAGCPIITPRDHVSGPVFVRDSLDASFLERLAKGAMGRLEECNIIAPPQLPETVGDVQVPETSASPKHADVPHEVNAGHSNVQLSNCEIMAAKEVIQSIQDVVEGCMQRIRLANQPIFRVASSLMELGILYINLARQDGTTTKQEDSLIEIAIQVQSGLNYYHNNVHFEASVHAEFTKVIDAAKKSNQELPLHDARVDAVLTR